MCSCIIAAAISIHNLYTNNGVRVELLRIAPLWNLFRPNQSIISFSVKWMLHS